MGVLGTTESFNTMCLYDSKGIIVRQETINENSFLFDRKNLSSGLYLMKIINRKSILTKIILLN